MQEKVKYNIKKLTLVLGVLFFRRGFILKPFWCNKGHPVFYFLIVCRGYENQRYGSLVSP